jgi:hypothetical protein
VGRPISQICRLDRNFGYSAAHEADPLPLLPSGPGGVCGESLHRARSSADGGARQIFICHGRFASLAQRCAGRKRGGLRGKIRKAPRRHKTHLGPTKVAQATAKSLLSKHHRMKDSFSLGTAGARAVLLSPNVASSVIGGQFRSADRSAPENKPLNRHAKAIACRAAPWFRSARRTAQSTSRRNFSHASSKRKSASDLVASGTV